MLRKYPSHHQGIGKTFDSVPHKGLMGNIIYYDITEHVSIWMACFPHNKTCSDKIDIGSGVQHDTAFNTFHFIDTPFFHEHL